MDLFDSIPIEQQGLSAEQEIKALRAELAEQNYKYYVLSAPTMSDREFDEKMHRLQELEAQHPELFDPESPTQKVGSDIERPTPALPHREGGNSLSESSLSDGFPRIKHRYPMLSLANTYSREEVEDWASINPFSIGEIADHSDCDGVKYDLEGASSSHTVSVPAGCLV